jgi:hypothetical protein
MAHLSAVSPSLQGRAWGRNMACAPRAAVPVPRSDIRPTLDEELANFEVTIKRRKMEGTLLPARTGD